MQAFELCGGDIHFNGFTIGKSKIVWESAVYCNCDKVRISRIVEQGEGGKPFLLGLRYKQRYISPDTIVNIIHSSLIK